MQNRYTLQKYSSRIYCFAASLLQDPNPVNTKQDSNVQSFHNILVKLLLLYVNTFALGCLHVFKEE